MGKTFSMTPEAVESLETRYRRIVTPIPVPESLGILEELRRFEPRSMTGQPLIIWDRAEGVNVYDPYGNKWLDWSSGVLVTNAGHGRQEIREAMAHQLERPLLHNYCFPSEIRAKLARRLSELAPPGLDKVFLLTTGSEAIECAIKLARTYGLGRGGKKKNVIVSFEKAFHGRTLGSQMVGGIPEGKKWIVNLDPDMCQVPFPGDFRVEDPSFSLFEKTLRQRGIDGDRVAAVISETFQGGGASFFPEGYVKELKAWCETHGALLILDEIQAGFGRTGRMFGFEHYGVVPDLAVFGKGITSCMPLSAVIGPQEIMDLYEPGTMTSTHSGNPVCCAAALANLDLIVGEGLVENAASVGETLGRALGDLKGEFPAVVGAVHGRGMVYGLHMVEKGSKEPDGELAFRIVEKAVQRGLMLFAPVGFGGATIKICPPLTMTEEAVRDGLEALREAFEAEAGA
ncbi:MAG: aspartate aminotransferase family protein [Deltaproteobacteria bacterium]|nr:aspartate aminotransferase family protein [Deltaproteobacteria bacterium]MBW2121022.1 aspartate aminotransferase family protein [Deltaproteobacteria bacterium]